MMRFSVMIRVLTILACGMALPAGPAYAVEEILSFHSDIEVHTNGSMTVTETIQVRAEGQKIKRGIFRDFPTTYKDRLGHKYVVGFDVKKVLRDGKPDGYHTKKLSNGIAVYIGRKEHRLKPGVYTYTLTYATDHQLGPNVERWS